MHAFQTPTLTRKTESHDLTEHAARVVQTRYSRDATTGELHVVADLKTLAYESVAFAWTPDTDKPLPNPGDLLLSLSFYSKRPTHLVGLEHPVLIDAPCPPIRATGLINVFKLLPLRWIKSKSHRDQAGLLFAQMTEIHRAVLWATLEVNGRMKGFACAPSSMRDHHSWEGGNFEHSIQVAIYAVEMAKQEGLIERGQVDMSLLILGSLLHDAGKALEYLPNDSECGYGLTKRGNLVGHQVTGQSWVAEALERISGDLSELDKLKIQHLICAAPAIPFELGGRQPRMIEADLIRAADQKSRQWSRRTEISEPENGCQLSHSPNEISA